MLAEELVVRIKADHDNYKKDMQEAVKITKNKTSEIQNVFSLLRKTLLFVGIGKALKDSVAMAYEEIEAQQKLTAILRQRANATDDQVKSILKLADAEQKRGIYANEMIIQGQQQLATFVNSTEALETMTGAMSDLVAQQKGFNGSGGDFVNVANMMGKAFQGQAGALSRVGITFTETEEKILKTGNEMERSAILAQIIRNNVGRMNEELAKTPQGRWRQITNDLQDLRKAFGYALIPVMQKLLPVGRGLVGVLNAIGDSVKAVHNWFNGLSPTMQMILKSFAYGVVIATLLKGAIGALAIVTAFLTKQVVIMGTAFNFAFWKLALVAGAIAGLVMWMNKLIGTAVEQPMDNIENAASLAGAGVGDLTNSIEELQKAQNKLTPLDEVMNVGEEGGLLGGLGGGLDLGLIGVGEFVDNLLKGEQATAGIAGWFAGTLKQEGNWFVNRLRESWELTKIIGSEIGKWFSNTFVLALTWGLDKFTQIFNLSKTIADKVSNWFKDSLDDAKELLGILKEELEEKSWWERHKEYREEAGGGLKWIGQAAKDTANLFGLTPQQKPAPVVSSPSGGGGGFSATLPKALESARKAVSFLGGGRFANGGRPPLGEFSMVGERGPELFVPDQKGTIISNEKLKELNTPQKIVQQESENREAVLVINGKEFARALFGNNREEGTRNGQMPVIRRVN